MVPSQVIALSIISLGIAVYIPILLRYTLRTKSMLSAKIKFKHKHKNLLYFIMIYTMFMLLLERPFVILCAMDQWNLIPIWIVSVMDSVFIAFALLTHSIYLWLFFYYKQYNIANSELLWKRQINPRYRSWYILNKNKYGNIGYLCLLLLAPFAIYIVIQIVIGYTLIIQNLTFSSSIIPCIFGIPFLGFYHKLLNCCISDHDISNLFCPKKEIKHQAINVIVFLFIQVALFGGEIFMKFYHSDYNNLYSMIISFINQFTVTAMIFVSALIAIYIAHKEARILSLKHKFQLPKKLSIATPRSVDREGSVSSTMCRFGVNAMLQIISHNSGFKAFMQHLV